MDKFGVLFFMDHGVVSGNINYTAYAGIRRGSLERRHQTTVGSRVTRTCCGHMLKFIRSVRNKFAGRRFRR